MNGHFFRNSTASGSQKSSISGNSFSMNRATILAILTFGLLILANLTTFGYLHFRSLSQKMVTEKLVEGLNEAQRLVNQELRDNFDRADNLNLSRRLAPQLRKVSFFQSVVVLDRQGRVVHRERIRSELRMAGEPQARQNPGAGAEPRLANFASTPQNQQVRHIPVGYNDAANASAQDTHLALEYNEDAIQAEVDNLSSELNRQMLLAVGVSLLLLIGGLAYVIWSYRRNRVLQEKAARADRLAYVGTLASGLAHEIRNPLNSMNMNIQLVQEELDESGVDTDEVMREMLEGTRGEIQRLEKMVSSFLAYARPTELSTGPASVNDLVMETVKFLHPEIEKAGIDLRTQLAADLPDIPLDTGQMKQALMNVIQNGVQVLDPGGLLEIRTRKAAGDKVLIIIRDEGPGISPEELKNIFKVFYSTKRGGTGLGLATAQRIVELHQGGIKVDSKVGSGTSFTFILPMEEVKR